MPQIGWFEILIIVILAILIIGPKDVPVIMKKIGNWIGSVKEYFNAIQEDLADVTDPFDEPTSIDKKTVNKENKNE